MTVEDFKNTCGTFFRLTFKRESDGELEFWYRDTEELSLKIDIEKLNNLFKERNNYQAKGETELYNDNYYEIPILFDNSSPSRRFNNIKKKDTVNGYDYKIQSPSDNYIIFLIDQLKIHQSKDFRVFPSFNSNMLKELFSRETKPELLSFISKLIPRFRTLTIQSQVNTKINTFENLSYSFIFNLSYNLDCSFLPLRFIDEIFRKIRIGRNRRNYVNDIETPKKRYINDLILYYQRGISTDSIDNQFLSFYHILEHFFEVVYQEDIINGIKRELTKPSFSYKKNGDIKKLISVIKKKLTYSNEEFSIKSEQIGVRVLLVQKMPLRN